MENNTISTPLRRLLIIFGVLLTVSLLASGANVYMTLAAPRQSVTVPSVVGFEGRLADSSGQPLEDGNYDVIFTLYSQATGGASSPCTLPCVWTETQTVTTHSGLYTVQLGSVNPTNNPLEAADFAGARWLGVKVGTEAELSPRISISSVPFALNAQEAAHAENADEAAQATHADDADHADEADQADQALGLQGRAVSMATPQAGDVLTWNNSNSVWQPAAPDNFEYPRRAFGFHINDMVVTGAALIPAGADPQMFSLYSYQNPGANGDTFTTSFTLQAGTYSLTVLGFTNYNRGKIDWYVDNVLQTEVSGQDWYASAGTYNVMKSGSITVVGDGYHVLKGVVNGKNASSSGYYLLLTEWWIMPASD